MICDPGPLAALPWRCKPSAVNNCFAVDQRTSKAAQPARAAVPNRMTPVLVSQTIFCLRAAACCRTDSLFMIRLLQNWIASVKKQTWHYSRKWEVGIRLAA